MLNRAEIRFRTKTIVTSFGLNLNYIGALFRINEFVSA